MSAEVGRVLQHICAGSFYMGQPVLRPAAEPTPSSQSERASPQKPMAHLPHHLQMKKETVGEGLRALSFSQGEHSEAQAL